MVNFVYAVGDRDTGQAVLVDPAYDTGGLLDLLEADGMACTGVLATHYHPDHVGGQMMGYDIEGVSRLLERVSVPIHVQAAEADLVKKVTGLEDDCLVSHASGDVVTVGDGRPSSSSPRRATPPAASASWWTARLVAGDTLFLEGCGRMDLPGSDPAQMYESLTTKLARVPDDAVLYPGHRYSLESSATMGITRERNVVFRVPDRERWLATFAG